jgi:hypothetical protein
MIDTLVAMADDRKHKKKLAGQPSTPSKPKRVPETTIIGSSSTWTENELDRYQVQCREGNVDINTLIPEKWFTIEKPLKYARGKIIHSDANCSARYVMFDFSRGRFDG